MRDTLRQPHRPPALLVRAEYPTGSGAWRTLGVAWSFVRAEELAFDAEQAGARVVVTYRDSGAVAWDTALTDGPLE